MRVVVTGSRDWTDRVTLDTAMDKILLMVPDMVLLHGTAAGADTLAEEWAVRNGVRVERWPADWKGHPRSGGIIRNYQMLNSGGVYLVAGFVNKCARERCNRPDTHWSHGSRHAVEYAQRVGIPTDLHLGEGLT